MFEIWGRTIYRSRRLVLLIAGLAVIVAAVWGTGVFGRLQSAGGFAPPDSESERAAALAAKAFGRDASDVVVLYSSNKLTVSSPAFRNAMTGSLARLPRSRVVSVTSYWSTGSPRFVSASKRATYAVLALAGGSDSARIRSFDAIKSELTAPGLAVAAGGQIPTEEAISKQVTSDVGRAEGISLPVLLILLTVIFGSLAAASLPLAIGGIGILGSFAALRLLTMATAVSIYSINITTILGLGLAIDYGLFMVARFREELHRHDSVEQALARTLATAGRTVAVSGLTVALALASLMLFPEVFLRSMGYGGVATVVVDMLAALTVLPALLAVLGARVNALRVRRSVPKPSRSDLRGFRGASPGLAESGGWYRLARSVMRRPAVYALSILVLLLALATPFLHISWGGTDARALPTSAPTRQVAERLARDFPGNVAAPIESVIHFAGTAASSPALQSPAGGAPAGPASTQLASYVRRLSRLPGVTNATVTGVRGSVARVDLGYRPDPVSSQARQIVAEVRGTAPPPGSVALVGGQSAQVADELSGLSATVPWMALVMAAATFVLLFLAFGSVVLPVKAIVMNLLSLSATFGVVVWIFQQGHLSGLLGFVPTGTLDPTMPVLMLAIIFGLSMDYEVFLLSRVRERYDMTGDNIRSVAAGLQRTGGIITSAALLLLVVIGAFSASGITFIKLMGVGMIVALIVDASIVRVLLVPATMRLLGRANWWAPGPLRRLYARYGLREEDSVPTAPSAMAGGTTRAS